MRHFLVGSAMLTGFALSAGAESSLAGPGPEAHHPATYEENRLDRAGQLALDASLSDIVLLARIQSVSTIGIPVDTTGNAFLQVPLYSLDVQRMLKGTVPGGVLHVVGGQNDPRPRSDQVGPDALSVICFLRDLVPSPPAPTPMQRARSQYYGFMRHGATSDRGYFTPPADSVRTFEGILSTAVREQSIEQLAGTAEVVATATVSGSVHDCGLPNRRRYCQETRVIEVHTGDMPDSLILVTSHFMRGIRRGSNLLFLRRLQAGIYQVEGAAAGAWWLDNPPQPDLASKLQRVQQITKRRQETPKK